MFYDLLEKACKEKGTTVTTVLVTLGISKGNIRNWKNGTLPKYGTRQKLAKYLEVPVELFLTEEEKQQNEVLNNSVKTVADFVSKSLNSNFDVDFDVMDKSEPRYAAYEALDGVSEDVVKDVLDFIKFKKSQKKEE